MDITLNTKMLDIVMPLCRLWNTTPSKVVAQILEQHAAMDANNNEQCNTTRNK